jgi:HlyD family secretion protein
VKAISIPLQALVVREKPGSTPGKQLDEEGVYVNKAGKATFVPVTTGLTGESNIEITQGLTEGEQIVTGPFRALRDLKDGAKVREQKEEKKDDEKKKA